MKIEIVARLLDEYLEARGVSHEDQNDLKARMRFEALSDWRQDLPSAGLVVESTLTAEPGAPDPDGLIGLTVKSKTTGRVLLAV